MENLTLMAVHAHPDDEAISTGGILARYAEEGVRTVLVTCTDGGCGDGPGGVKPGWPGFDRTEVIAARREELARSCAVLGIKHFESLGYPDSGMMGWPENNVAGSFWTTPVEQGAAKLADVMRRYRPQVIVTYDANGFYGHPDHIQAHRITMAAADATGIPDKVYFTAAPKSSIAEFRRRLRELGIEPPEGDTSGDQTPGPGPQQEWGTPDEEVTTRIDVSSVLDRKYDSLLAHASQSDNIFFIKMGRVAFGETMGWETFVRAVDRTGMPVPEDDLFSGLR
ncbi:MAG: PIG-L family deacetylase [Acidimicrobiales bacterium]